MPNWESGDGKAYATYNSDLRGGVQLSIGRREVTLPMHYLVEMVHSVGGTFLPGGGEDEELDALVSQAMMAVRHCDEEPIGDTEHCACALMIRDLFAQARESGRKKTPSEEGPELREDRGSVVVSDHTEGE